MIIGGPLLIDSSKKKIFSTWLWFLYRAIIEGIIFILKNTIIKYVWMEEGRSVLFNDALNTSILNETSSLRFAFAVLYTHVSCLRCQGQPVKKFVAC